ncbi:MAG: autotransporter-associated beta strand repeat-containing protein, partial [Verrucomicrobia bacterium]|nr:autotransporter-associated beta strand repeat-containing protein [Verrucomicrobiota bacterium]
LLISADPGLLLGFRATGGTGSSQSLVIALGTIQDVLTSGSFTLNLGHKSSLVSQTYGANWYTRDDLNWGVLGSDSSNGDAWISKTTGSPFPSAGGTTAINLSDLVVINTSFTGIQTASQQGNATLTNSVDSLGTDHQSSAYPNANSASWQSQAVAGWNYFPSATDSGVLSGLTIGYYTYNPDTFVGSNPVSVSWLSQSNGLISFATNDPSPSPTPSPTPTPAAASYVWTNTSGSWSQAANWSNTVPSNGVAVVFAGSGGFSTNNIAGLSLSSLTFSNTSGAYTLAGSNLIAGGIANNSSTNQVISLGVGFTNNAAVNAASGSLQLTGDVALSNGATVTIAGSFGSVLSGSVSGSGSLSKSGTGTATLSGSNSYTGGTTLSAGTLVASNSSALGNSNNSLAVNGGSLDLAGTTNTQGTVTVAGGTITNGGLSATYFQVQGGGISANLGGSGSLTKSGTGTATLSGSNSFSGSVTVNAGKLGLASGNAVSSANAISVSGGELSVGRRSGRPPSRTTR